MLSLYNQIWKMLLIIKAQGRDKKTIQVVMTANTRRRKDLDSRKLSQKSQASPRVEAESWPNKDIFLKTDHGNKWEMIHPC